MFISFHLLILLRNNHTIVLRRYAEMLTKSYVQK